MPYFHSQLLITVDLGAELDLIIIIAIIPTLIVFIIYLQYQMKLLFITAAREKQKVKLSQRSGTTNV